MNPSVRLIPMAIDVRCISGRFHGCRLLDSSNHLTDEADGVVAVVIPPVTFDIGVKKNATIDPIVRVRIVS